jgi:hypothetical protein
MIRNGVEVRGDRESSDRRSPSAWFNPICHLVLAAA